MWKRALALLVAMLLAVPAVSTGEEGSTVLFFPFRQAEGEEAQYIIELVTMQLLPLDGEIIAGDYYAYPCEGEANLCIYFSSGYLTQAYAEQLTADNLYGYVISFEGIPRDDVIAVKTFESGMQWPQEAAGQVEKVALVAGDSFYLMLEILQDGDYLPYSRTAIDCTGMALGESVTVAAAFDLPEYQEDKFAITVTKQLWLRRPLKSAPEANPEAILRIPQAGEEDAVETIEEPDVPLAAPDVRVALVTPSPVIGIVEVTNAYNINVRALPDQYSERLGVIGPGGSLDCVGIAENGWYAIRLPDGTEGYVSPKMVRFTAR